MVRKVGERRWLLTQNGELRGDGVYNWTLPAWVTVLPDGRRVNVCPSAGACARLCYARNGTYLFPAVQAAHQAKLRMVLDDLDGWKRAMLRELAHPRYRRGGHVRIHDSGDFFSDEYLLAWLEVARRRPWLTFYAYTKEVSRFRRLVEAADAPAPRPRNFLYVYSYGGREDHLLDPGRDRVADVFPDLESMAAAGFVSQDASDLLAVYGSPRVGIPANRIPGFLARMGGRTFRELQAERDERRARRAERLAEVDGGAPPGDEAPPTTRVTPGVRRVASGAE